MTEIHGPNLDLKTFGPSDIHADYLSWLNDPVVNQFSRRRSELQTKASANVFLKSIGPGSEILGIHLKDTGKHVGNIQYGPIDSRSKHAEIRILVGDRSVWGKGVATESIAVLSRYLFEKLGLRRLEANSCNPAFIACVKKLGWIEEGRMRERFLLDGKYVDYFCYGLLKSDYDKVKGRYPA